MKTTLFMLLACFLFSCEKSAENLTTPGEQNLSVTSVGINMNSVYRVQQLQGTQFSELPDPVVVKFVSEQQVAEKKPNYDFMVNDYRIVGKGTAGDNALRLSFSTLSPRCETGSCPIVTNDCQNVELYRNGSDIMLVKHYDSQDKVFKLLLQ